MMKPHLHRCALWLIVGCSGEVDPDSEPVSTEGLAALYADLQEDAEAFGYEDGQWTEDELQGLLAQFRAQPGQAFLQRTARAHGNLVPRRGEDVPEEPTYTA